MTLLQESWSRSWNALGAVGDGLALMEELIAAYKEPQRHYHTLQHLTECIALLKGHVHLAEHAGEVEIALWFHDAVYDVKAKDNEEKSADWAVKSLHDAGITHDVIERVRALIMATCHSAKPENADQQLLVDVDLAILGASRTRFIEYEEQVRAEYAWVPDALFRSTRLRILNEFNARCPIYNTNMFRKLFENQAHDNMSYSIAKLCGLSKKGYTSAVYKNR
jgi:predicted metal-dependent HD superfamily phosphohydrolase